MARNIFVSYEFTFGEVARTLPSWFQSKGGKCQGTVVMVFDKDARTDPEIDAVIRQAMKECQIAVFLTSENVHNKQWIDREAELAESMGLPIVAIPLDNSPAGLPQRLAGRRKVTRLTRWSPDELCDTLNRIVV